MSLAMSKYPSLKAMALCFANFFGKKMIAFQIPLTFILSQF
jgi:hypothetical protein